MIVLGDQLLSSLVIASLAEDDVDLSEGSDPSVHLQSLLRFRRPATGVSGHESLSDSEESRLSPARGPFGRGEPSSDEKAEELDGSDGDWTEGEEGSPEDVKATDNEAADDSDSEDAAVESEDIVDWEDSISECASVYLTFLISSSSGVRKETFFSAGNSGLAAAILRGSSARAGLLERIEVRLWGCLYGITMVAESVEADVRDEDGVAAELGVEDSLEVLQVLSIESRGFDGRARTGAAEAGGS